MNAVIPLSSATDEAGWQAQLALYFAKRGSRTAITRRRHHGPLVIQRPFYPEGDVCHAYLVHPPGGVVGGDQLGITANIGESAHALITTPASGKFYRSDGRQARLEQHLQVDNDAVLEWLPQDTILFAGCQVEMLTRIELAPRASFIGWEILCLGRPGSNELFDHGLCRQRFEIWRDGTPLFIDRSRFSGSDELMQAKWGLGGKTVSATLLATTADKQVLDAVRESVTDDGFSATLIEELLVCRYLGEQGEQARKVFQQAWAAIRPLLTGRQACVPRIWYT